MQATLPTGTVTLLFTDVEGSTDALRRLGARYRDALELHESVIRTAIAAAGGVEVDTQGDAFFVAFADAVAAVRAAARIQAELGAATWPEDVPLRVRMGIHTGEPVRAGDRYVGLDVNRAARIAAVAHGGQIVVSAVTRSLVGARAEVEFIDLGRARLKDFAVPERLFEAVLPGLGRRFPPLRTVSETNVPELPGAFVGRKHELATLGALLDGPRERLLTLVGPGGAGKSRLALELARRSLGRFAHGVRLVRLAALEDAAHVPSELAGVLGLRAADDLEDSIATHLEERELLLVVDNLEHLPDTGALLGRLLARCPRLMILATSRSPLRLAGERVVHVEPLARDEAVALFVDRATTADARFSLAGAGEAMVEALCERLDNLPLAIEIAAARVGSLTVTDMVVLLEPALETTGGQDLPARQRTLAATIGWSYDLLAPPLRQLHERLALFQAPFGIEAARDAFGASVEELEQLVRASLLRRLDDGSGSTRLGMLRVVREYALERLESDGLRGEAEAARDRWIDATVAHASTRLEGPEQGATLAALDGVLPDLRASLDDARRRGDAARALSLVAPLERFWRARADLVDARETLEWALAHETAPAPLRAGAYWTLGRLVVAQGRPDEAVEPLRRALELYRADGELRRTAFALTELAWIALDRGDLGDADARAGEALVIADEADDDRARSSALAALASVASERGEAALSRQLSEQSLAVRRALGDRLLVANAALTLGSAALADGDLVAARTALDECLELAREVGDAQHAAAAACCLGELEILAGAPDTALPLLREALATFVRLGNEPAAAECLVAVAAAALDHDAATALLLVDAAAAARRRAGAAPLPVERRLEHRVRSRVPPSSGARRVLPVIDAALLAGADPARI